MKKSVNYVKVIKKYPKKSIIVLVFLIIILVAPSIVLVRNQSLKTSAQLPDINLPDIGNDIGNIGDLKEDINNISDDIDNNLDMPKIPDLEQSKTDNNSLPEVPPLVQNSDTLLSKENLTKAAEIIGKILEVIINGGLNTSNDKSPQVKYPSESSKPTPTKIPLKITPTEKPCPFNLCEISCERAGLLPGGDGVCSHGYICCRNINSTPVLPTITPKPTATPITEKGKCHNKAPALAGGEEYELESGTCSECKCQYNPLTGKEVCAKNCCVGCKLDTCNCSQQPLKEPNPQYTWSCNNGAYMQCIRCD